MLHTAFSLHCMRGWLHYKVLSNLPWLSDQDMAFTGLGALETLITDVHLLLLWLNFSEICCCFFPNIGYAQNSLPAHLEEILHLCLQSGNRQLPDCIHSECRVPVPWETTVTPTVALSQFFLWVLYGKWLFSPVFPCFFVPIVSCTEIVVEAMYRVLVGGCRVALVRSGGDCPTLSRASSAHSTGQGTAEPCSHNGSASGKVHVRKGKRLQSVRSEGRVWKTTLQTPVRGGEDIPGVQAEILPAGDHTEAGILLQAMERTSLWQVDMKELKEPWSMESPGWSRFTLKCCSPWEGATLQKKRMQRKERKEEMLWSYHSPHSLHCLEGGSRGVRNERVKLSMSKKGLWEMFCFIFLSLVGTLF